MSEVRMVPGDAYQRVVALEKFVHKNGPERFYTMPVTQLQQLLQFLESVDRVDRNEPFVIDFTPTQRTQLRSEMTLETRDDPEALQRFAGYRFCDGIEKLKAIVETELILRDLSI